jgi:hypothetical protein
MVSKAIAALDVWLAHAEEVLQEQREQCISPNLAWRETSDEWTVTLVDLEQGLPDLLGSLCARPGRWILIAEDDECRQHFLQALAFEDGSLVTEVVSNRYLEGDERWTPTDEARLVELGWDLPNQPKRPNWIVVEPTHAPAVDEVAARVVATLRAVFRLNDESQLFVKMFSSRIRGNTPASPEYETPDDEVPLRDSGARSDPTCEGFISEEAMRIHLNVTGDSTDEELETMAESIVQWMEGCLGASDTSDSDVPLLIDPFGGPEEEDPEYNPDPTADDPPFADQELDHEDDEQAQWVHGSTPST